MNGHLQNPGGKVEIGYHTSTNRWELWLAARGSFFDHPQNVSPFDDPSVNRGSMTIRYLDAAPPVSMPRDSTLYFRTGSWDIVSLFSKSVPVPGLNVATGSIVEFHTTIHSNPVGGQITACPTRGAARGSP